MRHHAIHALLATAALLTAQQAVPAQAPLSQEQASARVDAPRLLQLKHATFDTRAAEPAIPADLRSDAADVDHFLVQIGATIDEGTQLRFASMPKTRPLASSCHHPARSRN